MREPKYTKATRIREITTTTAKKELEDPIIPPLQFRDDKPLQEPVLAPTIKNRAPKILKLDQALKGHTASSYTIEIQDNLDPVNHFTKTKEVVESHLKDLLKTMKGFKFIITLEVTFEKNTFEKKLESVNLYTKQHTSTVKLKPLLTLTKQSRNYIPHSKRYWV